MKQRIGRPRAIRKPDSVERRATEDTGGVPFRPPFPSPALERPQTARSAYMRAYLRLHHRRERWLAKLESRYLPFRDLAGDVLIVVGVPCALPSTADFRAGKHYTLPTLRPGRIYRLHWSRAASLEAGHLAELVEVSPALGERHPAAWGWTSLIPPQPAPVTQSAAPQPSSVRQIRKMVTAIARGLPREG